MSMLILELLVTLIFRYLVVVNLLENVIIEKTSEVFLDVVLKKRIVFQRVGHMYFFIKLLSIIIAFLGNFILFIVELF